MQRERKREVNSPNYPFPWFWFDSGVFFPRLVRPCGSFLSHLLLRLSEIFLETLQPWFPFSYSQTELPQNKLPNLSSTKNLTLSYQINLLHSGDELWLVIWLIFLGLSILFAHICVGVYLIRVVLTVLQFCLNKS